MLATCIALAKEKNLERTILFDLDGTLLDSQLGIVRCINYALERLGAPTRHESELVSMIGPPLYKGFGRLLQTDDDTTLRTAIAAYRERYDGIGIYECSLYDGVKDAVAALHQAGHPIHLVTAKPERYAERSLAHVELDSMVKGIYGPTLDDHRDGKAHLIRRAISGENIEPATAVMIGDRDRDLLGAKEVGISCIGALWGYGSADEISACSPDAVAATPGDIIALLDSLG